jgi:hypothetical protein
MTPGIDSKHAAEEEAGEDDDGQRADADDVGLHENVGAVRRLAKDVADGAAGEECVLLESENASFGGSIDGVESHGR